jgi:hypothetical protein
MKKAKKYESVRIRPDHKNRIETIMHTMALGADGRVTEIGIMTDILDKELPKVERKLGIS